jgi:hypothetical protein
MSVQEIRRRHLRIALIFILLHLLNGCRFKTNEKHILPRNEEPRMFEPHVAEFICQIEAANVPAIDAQADAWFIEAHGLEDREIYETNYKKIVELTRQAAARHHWKAMLNLASRYIEGRNPPRGVEDAVKLVEDAMRLGIPAAYDRMGTYYLNGTGVRGDATKGYAFIQKAAEMGSPQAMTFLGDKLRAGTDGAIAGYWANIPVAMKMLQCAINQGFGDAAYNLRYLAEDPRLTNGANDESASYQSKVDAKAHALRLLHDGVRLGCSDCANDLSVHFSGRWDAEEVLPLYPDKERAKRYSLLGDALSFDPNRRFPNLDRVLPLPPADLPPWNGDRDTLVKGAMGVISPRLPPEPTATSQMAGRYFLDSAYALRKTEQFSDGPKVPFSGYWMPTAPTETATIRTELAKVAPGLYQKDEIFPLYPGKVHGPISGMRWQLFLTIKHNDGAVDPLAPTHLVRQMAGPNPPVRAGADRPCPVTGTWQPWIRSDHTLSGFVNQYWRQAWIVAGQPFPDPQRDWKLNLPATEVTWQLMDSSPVNLREMPPTSATTAKAGD